MFVGTHRTDRAANEAAVTLGLGHSVGRRGPATQPAINTSSSLKSKSHRLHTLSRSSKLTAELTKRGYPPLTAKQRNSGSKQNTDSQSASLTVLERREPKGGQPRGSSKEATSRLRSWVFRHDRNVVASTPCGDSSRIPKAEAPRVALSTEQLRAVTAPLGQHLLVNACAGSGKTTVLLHRLKYLLEQGVPDTSIVLCTFTRAASANMASRLQSLLGRQHRVTCSTIDALALDKLTQMGPQPGIAPVGELAVAEYGLNFCRALATDSGREYLSGVQYLLVDEAQDLDYEVQYKSFLLGHVAANVHVMAVGDPAQTLYGFRGAHVDLFDMMQRDIPGLHVYHLRDNYRAHAHLVEVANAVIDKRMKSVGGRGPPMMVEQVVPTNPQVDAVAVRARQLVKQYLQLGYKREQIAVLCAANWGLYKVEEELVMAGRGRVPVPVQVLERSDGGVNFQQKLLKGRVCLATCHQAKGLEWEVVIVTGMNDRQFPYSKRNAVDIEEARRVMYVSVTRARSRLHVLYYDLKEPFITRYLHHVPAAAVQLQPPTLNWEYLTSSTSSQSHRPDPRAVTLVIQGLSGPWYDRIRAAGVLDGISFCATRLYEPYEWPSKVKATQTQSAMGVFLDLMISRMVGVAHPGSGGMRCRVAEKALRVVELTPPQRTCFFNHKSTVVANATRLLQHDTPPGWTASPEDLEVGGEEEGVDRELLGQVVTAVVRLCAEVSFDPSEVTAGRPPLPEGYHRRVRAALKRYEDLEETTVDMVGDVWLLAKMEEVARGRRRLLHTLPEVPGGNHWAPLYEQLQNKVVPLVTRLAEEGGSAELCGAGGGGDARAGGGEDGARSVDCGDCGGISAVDGGSAARESEGEGGVQRVADSHDGRNARCSVEDAELTGGNAERQAIGDAHLENTCGSVHVTAGGPEGLRSCDAPGGLIRCHEPSSTGGRQRDGVYLFGEPDVLAGSVLLDYKASTRTDVQADWVLQLLAYVAMYRDKGVKVRHVGIVNVLQGVVHLAELGEWDRGQELMELLKERKVENFRRTDVLADEWERRDAVGQDRSST